GSVRPQNLILVTYLSTPHIVRTAATLLARGRRHRPAAQRDGDGVEAVVAPVLHVQGLSRAAGGDDRQHVGDRVHRHRVDLDDRVALLEPGALGGAVPRDHADDRTGTGDPLALRLDGHRDPQVGDLRGLAAVDLGEDRVRG